MKRAFYKRDWGPFAFLFIGTGSRVEVDLVGYEEHNGLRYARIIEAVPENSVLGLLAKRYGVPNPRPIEKLVRAAFVEEIGGKRDGRREHERGAA
jgi:hypothetical protein